MKLKMYVRFLVVLLLFAMALAAVGCGQGKKPQPATGDTSAQETQSAEPPADDETDLPSDLRFNDPEISFLIGEPSANKGGTFTERSIMLEDFDPDAKVDYAVYSRNMQVEDQLNVTILCRAINDAIIKNTLMNDLLSGESAFDILGGYQAWDIALAQQGIVMNLNKLGEYGADYIGFEKPYWSQQYDNALAYKGSMYWITGDLALRYLGGMYCTFVNLQLYNDVMLTKHGSIYDLVDDGAWTLDTLEEMSREAYMDLDENESGGATGTSAGDRLGLVVEKNDMLDGMAVGAGVVWSTTDGEGNVQIAITDTALNQAAVEFAQKMYRMFYEGDGAYYVIPHNHSAKAFEIFNTGRTLFVHDKVYQAENYLGEFENYGIIPSPKLNAAQENYRTGIHDGCTLFGLMATGDTIPASAATLELMAALSYKTVRKVYYDETLHYKYSRDPDSSRMVDLIHDSVYIDFAFAWGNSLNSVHNIFRDTVTSQSTATTFKKQKNVIGTLLEDLVAKLEQNA